MSIDERHVTTALQAYARGLDVTDADLDHLEAQLGERLHPAPRQNGPRHPWEWAVAACAVVALVLAVTALWRTRAQETLPATTPPPSITARELAGLWVVELANSDGYLWHFSGDGRRAVSRTPEQYVDLGGNFEPFTLGPGDVFTFPVDGGSCRATVGWAGQGRMTLTPLEVQDNCPYFPDGEVWPFTRVSPASVAGTAMVRSPNVTVAQLPATQQVSLDDVVGTWLLQGTGTTLVVAPGPAGRAQYVLDDDGDGTVDPDQRGTLTLRPDGGVVLRPSTGAPCDTVYSRVANTGATLEVELDEAGCGRVGATHGAWFELTRVTWIRLN